MIFCLINNQKAYFPGDSKSLGSEKTRAGVARLMLKEPGGPATVAEPGELPQVIWR
jgi:hypothetical protein